jgi:putative oxidoreductase
MKRCKQIYAFLEENILNKLQDIALLTLRLVLAYGFYDPALRKWEDIHAVAGWFESGLHLPFPLINAYLAATTELLGVILLTLGLFTRVITLPLMVVMLVAIFMVHLSNGFSAGDQGFEIPLYYLLMLLTLASHGGGKFSLDHFIMKK